MNATIVKKNEKKLKWCCQKKLNYVLGKVARECTHKSMEKFVSACSLLGDKKKITWFMIEFLFYTEKNTIWEWNVRLFK